MRDMEVFCRMKVVSLIICLVTTIIITALQLEEAFIENITGSLQSGERSLLLPYNIK